MTRVWTALNKPLRYVGWALLMVGVVAGILTAVVFGAVHTGKVSAFYVTSYSMKPEINGGDLIITTPAPASSVQVGDIITVPVTDTMTGQSTHVTHRVVEIDPGITPEEREITLRGDANPVPDAEPFIGTEVLEHRVTVPYGGNLLHFLRTPPTPYFFIIVLLAAIGFTFLPPTEDEDEGEGEGTERGKARAKRSRDDRHEDEKAPTRRSRRESRDLSEKPTRKAEGKRSRRSTDVGDEASTRRARRNHADDDADPTPKRALLPRRRPKTEVPAAVSTHETAAPAPVSPEEWLPPLPQPVPVPVGAPDAPDDGDVITDWWDQP